MGVHNATEGSVCGTVLHTSRNTSLSESIPSLVAGAPVSFYFMSWSLCLVFKALSVRCRRDDFMRTF